MTAALLYQVVVFVLALLLVPALPRGRGTSGTATPDVAADPVAGPAI